MTVSFSVIVPTGGERTPRLLHALSTIVPQLQHGDEIIVSRYDCLWGHKARNLAMPRAAGTHLMFCDDDDSYMGDALANVRRVVVEKPERIHIFAMTQGQHVNICSDPPACGSVGTPMIVVPNKPGKLGTWSEREYEGDWRFLESTMKLHRWKPIIHEISIARIGE